MRPGSKKGDRVVTDIVYLKYEENGNIYFKTDFNNEWEILLQKKLISTFLGEPKQLKSLYDEPLSITESKFKDLQSLRQVIEPDHHIFYDQLKYKKDKKKK